MRSIASIMTQVGIPQTVRFPYASYLNFLPLMERWRALGEGKSGLQAEILARLEAHVKQHPELLQPIDVDGSDPDCFDPEAHKDWLHLLFHGVFPVLDDYQHAMSLMAPFGTQLVFETPRFRQLMDPVHFQGKSAENVVVANGKDATDEMMPFKVLMASLAILQRIYQFNNLDFTSPLTFRLPDPDTGTIRYFRAEVDPSLVDVIPLGELPSISRDQVDACLQNLEDWQAWLALVPPDKFRFEGVMIFQLVDITDEESLSQIQRDLLEHDNLLELSAIKRVEAGIREYFALPDINLGLGALTRIGALLHHAGTNQQWSNHLASCADDKLGLPMEGSAYFQMHQTRKAVLVNDLQAWPSKTWLENRLLEKGIRNLLIFPLEEGDTLMGFMELSSNEAGRINTLHKLRLRKLMPLMQVAMRRTLEAWNNQVQRVVRDNFTAIHPVVEWRFDQAAQRYLDARRNGENVEMPHIRFKSVYPLFGQADIRHSSDRRNEAVREDLTEQLNLADEVLACTLKAHPIDALEELRFRISEFKDNLEGGLHAADESRLQEFFRRDLHPLFDHLEVTYPICKNALASYRATLDPEQGMVVKSRDAYEHSLNQINEAILEQLEAQQKQAQAIFPHYFERYKTDGVEYNIYIGADLVPERPFHDIYLHNLRLWQLHGMSQITQRNAQLADTLPLRLETAQLILVHHNPLDIRFRMDEKRFDVDGAYNIRYEIIKKRLDKALIEGTRERITQPGKVVIVFDDVRDLEEYRGHIAFLQHRGMLTDEVESFKLQPMQGVQGMQALRVTVADADSATEAIDWQAVVDQSGGK